MCSSDLRGVAETWSSGLHVARAPVAQQRYFTAVLLEGLRALPPSASSAPVPTLLSGVPHHLAVPDAPSRRLGLRFELGIASWRERGENCGAAGPRNNDNRTTHT